MRRLLGTILLLTLAVASRAATSNLAVKVQTSAGVAVDRAQVLALTFNNGRPDPAVSTSNFTDATGWVGLPLTVGSFYQIFVSSQGFAPALLDQFGGNPPSLTAAAAPATSTITINSAGVSGVGEIRSPISNATANSLIFGQVGLKTGGGASAFGVAATNAAGFGFMRFANVSTAPAGTYQVSVYDPASDRSTGTLVHVPFSVVPSSIVLSGLSLSAAVAQRPIANISQTQTAGASGGLSVYGLVTDTNSVGIPYLPLNFQSQYLDTRSSQTVNDWRGAQTDQNGVFQLYDLRVGSNYYATIYGGCNPNTGLCYQGSQSTAAPAGAPGINDFLYASSATVLNHRIMLAQMLPSNGAMTVYVKDQYGNTFPQAGIGLWPDGMPWQTSGGGSCGGGPYLSQPGFKTMNANAPSGSVSVTGLPSGNYQLNVWTPYGGTSFNGGHDGVQDYSASCSASGTRADDLRLTIDTMAAAGQMVGVYDVFGNIVSSGLPSVTVTVNVSTGATGMVRGTLTFPSVVDLSASPISIVLYPNCGNNGGSCSGGGFAAFSSASTGPTVSYAIPVSSGQNYWMQVLSGYWGAVYPGGNQPQPDLTKTSSSVINMSFFPAGRVTGYMRKPDGSIYVPPTDNNSGGAPSINAEGNSSWGYTQVSADGSYTIGGLIPGDYTLNARSQGGQFPYTTKQPATHVTSIANATVTQDVYLADAVRVKPTGTGFLPPLNIVSCPANSSGDCPPETWKAYALPQGTQFTPATVTNLLGKGGSDSTPGLFFYSKSSGTVQSNGCYGQFLSTAGFCTNSVAASQAGSTYDFYLMRSGAFDSENLASGSRPYFVIESSTKSVIIAPTRVDTVTFSSMGSITPTPTQRVSVKPAVDLSGLQQATLNGTVTAANMINLRQFQSLGGNFDKFMDYLPVVWIYDAAGALKASGLVVPFPPNMSKSGELMGKLDQSVATGDFSQFQSLTGPVSSGGWGPLGFEIRGLTANTQYNMLVTTPNYPPYKTSVNLGAANSATTADVNLDANAGATLTGVVQSTGSARIAGAQVTVKAPGYTPTTLTTDANGAWSVSGLSAGRYQVAATAAGYAQGAQTVDVVDGGVVTAPAFSLRAANVTISGTVYTNNPVCPAGATCSAFGKTVLQGISVMGYDDTLNLSDPSATLPLFRAVTDSSGTYAITVSSWLIAGTTNYHSYKLFVNAPGYFVLNQSTEAVPGGVTGFDFALKPKPLDIGVFGRPKDGVYEFQITNYEDFSAGNAWVGASPFVMATSTPLPQNAFFEIPDANGDTHLYLTYSTATLVVGTEYTLHLEAQPNDPRADKVVKEIPFGLGLPHATCQSVDQALIGDGDEENTRGIPNNTLTIDIQGGNNSGLSMPVGGVIPILSTAIPSMCMSETDASASSYTTSGYAASGRRTMGLSRAAFASGVYNVSLSSVNYTAKGVDLTLYYDQTGTSLDDLAVYHYNGATLAWESVPGLQTIDPVQGTISVKGLKSLASVLTLAPGPKATAAAKNAAAMQALSDGKGYRPNTRVAATTDTGVYAVLRPSQVNGGVYTGTVVKVFNFPNPFNLQPKSITLNGSCSGSAGSTVTGGTVIKYEIPSGVSGQGVIRIYTTSGRLVRELDAGPISPNKCYYTQWDGRNRSDQPVANGVYYGILSVGGSAQTSATFKLAVIK